jgi:hypothetical protein
MPSGSEAVRVLEHCREGILKELAAASGRAERRAHLEQVLARIEQALQRLKAKPPPSQAA